MKVNDTRIVLGSLRYKSAPNTELRLDVDFDSDHRQILEFEPNTNVDLTELFDQERQKATVFRPTAKLVLLFENAYSGETNYRPFKDNLYYVNELFYATQQAANPGIQYPWGGYPDHNEFEFIRTDYQVTGYTVPPNQHVYFLPQSASSYNWNIYLSYVFSGTNKWLRYDDVTSSGGVNLQNWYANDGIPFMIFNTVGNGYNLITLRCRMYHGVSPGEFVILTDEAGNPMNYQGSNIYQVFSVGNGLYDSERYYINLYDYGILTTLGNPFTTGKQGTLKRIIDIENSGETMSKYYVRQHKILTTASDAIINKSGFELNVFNQYAKYLSSAVTSNYVAKVVVKSINQSYLLSFAEDVDAAPLLDNHGRPIEELFYTVIHKGYFGWFYQKLSPANSVLKEGYVFNMSRNNVPTACGTNDTTPSTWWNLNFIRSYSSIPFRTYVKGNFTFYYNDVLNFGDVVDGDFCEWNDFEQTERVISKYIHKFYYNTLLFNNTGTPPCAPSQPNNPNGYYYIPHHSVKIRQYSDYIEEGDPRNTDFIPEYAIYSAHRKVFRWRDLYTYGFVDSGGNGVNLPFLNGVHHPHLNINFRVMPEGYNFDDIITEVHQPKQDECE